MEVFERSEVLFPWDKEHCNKAASNAVQMLLGEIYLQ